MKGSEKPKKMAKKPAQKSHAQHAAPAPAAEALPPGPNGAPGVAAAAWVLVDTLSGQTLAGVNADERRDPASLTKLMTAYRVFAALRAKTITASQMVEVSQRATGLDPSFLLLERIGQLRQR